MEIKSASRPTRACELKCTTRCDRRRTGPSRPTRACELKSRLFQGSHILLESRPTRACELKSPSAPAAPSRPTRVCRLKLYRDLQIKVKPQYSEFTNNSQDKKWHDRKAASNLKKEAA